MLKIVSLIVLGGWINAIQKRQAGPPFPYTMLAAPMYQFEWGISSGPCSTRLAEVEARFAAANGMLVGLERPLCDANGDYKGMQYQGSGAFCVATDGTEIAGFTVNRWEAVDIDCQSELDQNAYKQTGLIGRMFSCDRFGNYAPTGCTGSVCFCQDRSGNPIGDTRVNIGQLDALNC